MDILGRRRHGPLIILTLAAMFASVVTQAQLLTKEYIYVGGRLVAVEVPSYGSISITPNLSRAE